MERLSVVKVQAVFGVDKRAKAEFQALWGTAHRGYAASDSKEYTYRALSMLNLAKGDLAIVQTPTAGLTVVTITNVEEVQISLNSASYKWVLCKVDVTATKTAIEREENIRRLTGQLEALAQEERRRIDFREILAGNSAAQELLAKLEELEGGRTT